MALKDEQRKAISAKKPALKKSTDGVVPERVQALYDDNAKKLLAQQARKTKKLEMEGKKLTFQPTINSPKPRLTKKKVGLCVSG